MRITEAARWLTLTSLSIALVGCGNKEETAQAPTPEPAATSEAPAEGDIPALPPGVSQATDLPPTPVTMPTADVPDLPPSGSMAAAAGSFLESLQRKAEAGAADSAYFLALKYLNGDGTEKDIEKAVKWFKASANKGYADAQYQIGLMNEKGTGVPENKSMAAMWYLIAGGNNHDEALQRVDTVMSGLSDDEKEEVERMASSFVSE